MSIYSDKVNAVAMCYAANRRDGDSHERAEEKCYRQSANMQIDSYELREGVALGVRKFNCEREESKMTIEITDLNFDALLEDQLIELVRDALPRLSTTQQADAFHEAEWVDSEGKSWEFPCYLIRLGSRVIMWSNTDEAGVDDETIAEAEDDIGDQVKEFATDLADQFGPTPEMIADAAKSEARELLETIDSGWDESMWENIEENADMLDLCPADIGMLYHHMNGTEDVRAEVEAMLRNLAA